MDTIYRIRVVLNILFMIGAFASVILYFTSDNQTLFFYVCCIAIFLKMVEFILRFFKIR